MCNQSKKKKHHIKEMQLISFYSLSQFSRKSREDKEEEEEKKSSEILVSITRHYCLHLSSSETLWSFSRAMYIAINDTKLITIRKKKKKWFDKGRCRRISKIIWKLCVNLVEYHPLKTYVCALFRGIFFI